MRKGFVLAIMLFIVGILLYPIRGMCQAMSNEEIMEELRALKGRIQRLEEQLDRKDQEIHKLKEETKKTAEFMTNVLDEEITEGGLLDKISERVLIGALVEVGAVYESVHNDDGTDEDFSDINLTTVEIGVEVDVNDWVDVEMAALYEDAIGNTAADESDIGLDVATVTFGNADACPFYVTAGKMYVPYGALLTHFPDAPLVDVPITLAFGEISEKAVLVGYEHSGLSVSGYVFNGEVDESANDNTIDDFGFDVNYSSPEDSPVKIFAGLSYISNVAEGLGGELHDTIVSDYIDGIAGYLHLGFCEMFLDAEYMTSLDEFAVGELSATSSGGEEPSAWNIETGYNWNWGKNLEIALKYAGSDDTAALGYPEKRWGLAFNQEIFNGITGSVAYYRDDFHSGDTRDDRDVLCGQVAVEF